MIDSTVQTFLDKLKSRERENDISFRQEKTCKALISRGVWKPVWEYAVRMTLRSRPLCRAPNEIFPEPGISACSNCSFRMKTEGLPGPLRRTLLHNSEEHWGNIDHAAHAANIWRLLAPFSGHRFSEGEWRRSFDDDGVLEFFDSVPNPFTSWVETLERALRTNQQYLGTRGFLNEVFKNRQLHTEWVGGTLVIEGKASIRKDNLTMSVSGYCPPLPRIAKVNNAYEMNW